MAMEAKMSVLGLLNWDEDLFEDMSWPDAFSPAEGETEAPLDKVAFLAELAAQTAELEVIYPRPDIMKNIIRVWSKTRVGIWNQLWDTTQYEYNPIENYDRSETSTDTHNLTYNHNGADTTTDTPHAEHFEAAYDSTAGQDDDGLVKTTRDEGLNTSQIAYNSANTDNGTIGHTSRIHGNIGVVSSQQMILQQREVVKFSLYDVMIQDFKDRFCILVY